MAIQFIQFHETLIKVTPLVSELLVFMTLQRVSTVRSGSSFSNSLAWLPLFVWHPKRLRYIFVLRRFKYSVIVYQCSLGELQHDG